jgi:hypothetical protein
MTFDEEKRDSAKAPSTERSTKKDSDLQHDCGSSICSIDETSSITAFGSVLAPLHEFEYRDVNEEEEEEDLEEEDLMDPDHSESRWGEHSSSSWSEGSFREDFAHIEPLQVPRKYEQDEDGQDTEMTTIVPAAAAALTTATTIHQDSFRSTTTTISTSSLDSMDAAPIQPKRRVISFSNEVEVHEYQVKAASSSKKLSSPVVHKGKVDRSILGDDIDDVNEDDVPTVERWQRGPMPDSEMDELHPPRRIPSIDHDH